MHKILAGILLGAPPSPPAPPQAAPIDHMEPPFWWAGMHDKRLQLMVHGPAIADLEPVLDYPGVRIAQVTRVANRNYLFIDLAWTRKVAPGSFASTSAARESPGRSASYTYRLLAREPGSAQRKGFDTQDAIYQLMPDRFANGDPKNDSVAGLADKLDRKLGHGRHGGDIQGMIDHLDYIAGLGFTQLWPTPLVENDMKGASYHGYAATDHYKIDPRYGSNEDFVRLSREARKHGIGLIQDVVLSHIGLNHWWMKDLPTPDWINHPGKFVPTRTTVPPCRTRTRRRKTPATSPPAGSARHAGHEPDQSAGGELPHPEQYLVDRVRRPVRACASTPSATRTAPSSANTRNA
jgi:hypothetical protein